MSRSGHLVLVLVLAATLLSCGSGLTVSYLRVPDPQVPIHTVVILELVTHFRGSTGVDVYEKWMDLAHQLEKQARVFVVGPDEIHVTASGAIRDPLRDTNLLQFLGDRGISRKGVLVVTPMVVESWQEEQAVVVKGERRKERSGKIRSGLQVRYEVYILSSGERIVSAERNRSAILERGLSPSDRRPDVTRYVNQSHQELVTLLHRELGLETHEGAVWPGWTVYENPQDALNYSAPGLPSAMTSNLKDADAVTLELARRSRLEYRYKELPRSQVRAMTAAEAGVTIGEAPPCARLLPGDLVTEVNGVKVTREYQLRREFAWGILRGDGLALTVVRHKETLTVEPSCN